MSAASPIAAALRFEREAVAMGNDAAAPGSLWSVSVVRAFEDNASLPVGRLRISYITESTVRARLATPYAVMGHRGFSSLRAAARVPDSQPIWAAAATEVAQDLLGWCAATDRSFHTKPLADIKAWLGENEPEFARRHRAAIGGFLDFHVNRPNVDYIEVRADCRRRGVSLGLYREASDWLAEQGLALHASGAQEPAARKAWVKMEELGWTDMSLATENAPARQRLRPRMR